MRRSNNKTKRIQQVYYLIVLLGIFLFVLSSFQSPALPRRDVAILKPKVVPKDTDSSSSLTTSSTSTTKKISMGFTKEILRAGNGLKPKRGQNVTVHCTGFGKNRDLSQKFWSTKDRQQPFTFAVGTGSVIKGWDESVIDMSIGEVARIHCSPDYAYGAGGFPAWGIMPNSELVFEIEILKYA